MPDTTMDLADYGWSPHFQSQLDLADLESTTPVRVLAVARVTRSAAGLHIGAAPGLRPEASQEGRGVEGSRAHVQIVGLQEHAALIRPVALEGQDEPLECGDIHMILWIRCLQWGCSVLESEGRKYIPGAGRCVRRELQRNNGLPVFGGRSPVPAMMAA